ncbi:MAG: DEAD/DEAH box helicase, partial [Candidatus Diapherotrites archaeon]|nr:DEAD/DEAH box helicase [Candidatus Diapherotrites archaeon]
TTILKQKGFEHPKLYELKDIIEETFNQGPNSKVIVFAHFRDSASLIVKTLNDLKGVNAVRFVGQASKDKDKGLTQKQQAEIINQFKDGEFNVLVATSVAEEGLDLPSVDLVVFYEAIPSEIRTIQRRGRTGRHNKGKYIVLLAKGTRDEAYYWSSKRKEQGMIKALKTLQNDGLPSNKQTSLLSFAGKKSVKTEDGKRVKIFVDMRERASGIVNELRERNVELVLKQLDLADFILSEDVAVERKEQNDFIQSLISGRLFDQIRRLSSTFEKPLLIVEGREDLYALRDISPNALRATLSSIALDYGIPILFSKDVGDTADFLVTIAKREQLDLQKEIKLRGDKRIMSLPETQQFLIEGLPGIGPSLTKTLLKHFGSVEGVFHAGVSDLKEVEGIGEKRAKEIRKVIEEVYTED